GRRVSPCRVDFGRWGIVRHNLRRRLQQSRYGVLRPYRRHWLSGASQLSKQWTGWSQPVDRPGALAPYALWDDAKGRGHERFRHYLFHQYQWSWIHNLPYLSPVDGHFYQYGWNRPYGGLNDFWKHPLRHDPARRLSRFWNCLQRVAAPAG